MKERTQEILCGHNRALLDNNGWFSAEFTDEVEEELLAVGFVLANGLGTPCKTRSDGKLYDTLSPTVSKAAHASSLSRSYSTGEFPMHTDTAHWSTPCRYIILICVCPGSGERPTYLLNAHKMDLDQRETYLLKSLPLRVLNGRHSFFSTIASNSRPFIRYDPGCMKANTIEGHEALRVYSSKAYGAEKIQWKRGLMVVFDNWVMLHGRGCAKRSDIDRKIMRISVL